MDIAIRPATVADAEELAVWNKQLIAYGTKPPCTNGQGP